MSGQMVVVAGERLVGTLRCWRVSRWSAQQPVQAQRELAPVFTVRGIWCGYSAVVSADARPAPVVLGSWPTPLEPAPRLAAAVGLAADALWVKRDDVEFRFNV